MCEDSVLFLGPKSGCEGFLAEFKEQIVVPEMCEGSQESRNVQNMQPAFLKSISNSPSWPKFPPEQGCGRTAVNKVEFEIGDK